MTRKWTRKAAFEYFGTKQRNVRWSCSAKSPDGKTVVVTLWKDVFQTRDGSRVYERDEFDPGTSGLQRESELMKNLAWAQHKCAGRFNVIIATAKDISADKRSIKECFPTKMIMRLTSLNPTTGAFAAEAERA